MDAAFLSFNNNEFDVVSISNSLHHIPEVHKTLKEMVRVLKPGGVIVIQEMVCDGLTETQQTHRDLHHWWAAIDQGCGISHGLTFTRAEINAFLSGVNLISQQTCELIDLESDPKDISLQQELAPIFSHYFERAAALPNAKDLRLQGEALQNRLETIGFHAATALFITANKPAPAP